MIVRINVEGTEYNLTDDFGWLIDFEDLPAPTIRTNYKEIPARNGILDLTEVDGQVYYDQLNFTLVCQKLVRKATDCLALGRQMMNLFNGQQARVYIGGTSTEPETYYYDSRIQITNYYREGLVFNVEMEISAYPYRLSEEPTNASFTLSGSARDCVLQNDIMPVVPTITASAPMTISYGGKTFAISAGNNILLPDLVLESGANTLNINGSGTITFAYTRGTF